MENYFNINPEKKIVLPEGTPVYITTTKQIGFYEKPASMEGVSRIKNIGVVPNEELRKPTSEELLKWANERSLTDEELKPIQTSMDNWNANKQLK